MSHMKDGELVEGLEDDAARAEIYESARANIKGAARKGEKLADRYLGTLREDLGETVLDGLLKEFPA